MIRRALRSWVVRLAFGVDPAPLVAELRGLRSTVLRLHREQLEEAHARSGIEDQLRVAMVRLHGDRLERAVARQELDARLAELNGIVVELAHTTGSAKAARMCGVEPLDLPCPGCLVEAGTPCTSPPLMGPSVCWVRLHQAWDAFDAKNAASPAKDAR